LESYLGDRLNLEEILGPKGLLSRLLDGYEYRSEQKEICQTILDSFHNSGHCIVEAGTGVGKSLAYLIPAVLAAMDGKCTVISTHTINLQTQLIEKDIPLVQKLFPEFPFKAVLMKGRGNYLCLQDHDYAKSDLFYASDPQFVQIGEWIRKTNTGDVADLPFSWPYWYEIACNQDTCRGGECRYYDRCFYFKMRKEAAKANIIVVNHALFLCDLLMSMQESDNQLLPDYDAVVFDEAHHLEDVATRVFGNEVTSREFPHCVDRLRRLKDLDLNKDRFDALEILNEKLFVPFDEMKGDFFLKDALRVHEAELEVKNTATQMCVQLEAIENELIDRVKGLEPPAKERVQGYARMAGRMREELHLVVFQDSANYIQWGENVSFPDRRGNSRENKRRTHLYLTPIDVSAELRTRLWEQVDTVILTSATLSNSGGFRYIRARLGTPDKAIEKVVGSPFDFKHQALLYVPWHLPEPPKSLQPAWIDQASEEIKRVIELTEGRAFLLFTSRRMMNEIYEKLNGTAPYPLFRQGDQPPGKLLEAFRQSGNGCLLGVQTFWEGVDVRGEALSCVIIDRLPFGVPDTPINKARTQAITDAGGDWFNEYSIPQAQIRLKQGFGRLIRTHDDIGLVCILDSRIHHRAYGRQFVDYLPPASRASKWDRVCRIWKEIQARHENKGG
jgi:ATP-dependent DNA helicase DinG